MSNSNFTTPIVLIAAKDAPRLGGDYFDLDNKNAELVVRIKVIPNVDVYCMLSQAETIVAHYENIGDRIIPASDHYSVPKRFDERIESLMKRLDLVVEYEYVADEVFTARGRANGPLDTGDAQNQPLVLIVDWDDTADDFLFRCVEVDDGYVPITTFFFKTSASKRAHYLCNIEKGKRAVANGPVEPAGVETVTSPNLNGDYYGTPEEVSKAYKDFLRDSAKMMSFASPAHPHPHWWSQGLIDTQLLSYLSNAKEESAEENRIRSLNWLFAALDDCQCFGEHRSENKPKSA